jgi:hypothetical protein
MRHYLRRLASPRPPPALPGGVPPCAGAAPLIPGLCPPQRLAAADPRALPGAVHVAVVAALADTHLNRTPLAVVEPIRRLGRRPQRPPPERWTALGQAGIKGLHTAFPRRCASGARGRDANPITRALALCSSSQHSLTNRPRGGRSPRRASRIRTQRTPELLPLTRADCAGLDQGMKDLKTDRPSAKPTTRSTGAGARPCSRPKRAHRRNYAVFNRRSQEVFRVSLILIG